MNVIFTASLREAFDRAGMPFPDREPEPGRIARFATNGRADDLAGWLRIFPDTDGAAFGDWRSGASFTWQRERSGPPPDPAELAAIRRRAEEARKAAEAARRAEHEARAIEARGEWDAAHAADPAHRYLIAKAVQPHNLRQAGGALLVPLFDAYGLLWNVQRIAPDGGKRFRPGRAGGLLSPIGDLTDPARLLVCEGWATGSTLHKESGHAVLCAMNAGNLLAVATTARFAWPGADLVICADNDRHTAGNPGITAATAAAKATGARLIVPEFPEGVAGSDWNDLAAIRREGAAR